MRVGRTMEVDEAARVVLPLLTSLVVPCQDSSRMYDGCVVGGEAAPDLCTCEGSGGSRMYDGSGFGLGGNLAALDSRESVGMGSGCVGSGTPFGQPEGTSR